MPTSSHKPSFSVIHFEVTENEEHRDMIGLRKMELF